MPLRERQEVEEMSRSAGVTGAKLKPAAEQLCFCLQWIDSVRSAGLDLAFCDITM